MTGVDSICLHIYKQAETRMCVAAQAALHLTGSNVATDSRIEEGRVICTEIEAEFVLVGTEAHRQTQYDQQRRRPEKIRVFMCLPMHRCGKLIGGRRVSLLRNVRSTRGLWSYFFLCYLTEWWVFYGILLKSSRENEYTGQEQTLSAGPLEYRLGSCTFNFYMVYGSA